LNNDAHKYQPTYFNSNSNNLNNQNNLNNYHHSNHQIQNSANTNYNDLINDINSCLNLKSSQVTTNNTNDPNLNTNSSTEILQRSKSSKLNNLTTTSLFNSSIQYEASNPIENYEDDDDHFVIKTHQTRNSNNLMDITSPPSSLASNGIIQGNNMNNFFKFTKQNNMIDPSNIEFFDDEDVTFYDDINFDPLIFGSRISSNNNNECSLNKNLTQVYQCNEQIPTNKRVLSPAISTKTIQANRNYVPLPGAQKRPPHLRINNQ